MPVGRRGHLLVTPQLPRFALTPKPLIALPISTIRTSRLDVRSQVLYPAELRAQARSLTFAGHFWNLIQVRGLPARTGTAGGGKRMVALL